ncbi:MAG: hypothetical protein ACOZAQ_10900 [Pseudomonadota bacterium]
MGADLMDGMQDIIPPLPVHGGLAGLMDPGGLPPELWLSLAALLPALLTAAWLMRRRLIARLRLAQARRMLLGGRVGELEDLIRRHLGLPHLHPARPPHGMEPAPWRTLVSGLHAARFGLENPKPAASPGLLILVFSSSPPPPPAKRRAAS